MLKHQQARLTQ